MSLPCSIEKKAKFHRKRVNEEEGDITYINEHNRVFNKKVSSTFVLAVAKLVLMASPSIRFHGTTTSTQRRFVQASSVERRFDPLFCIFRAFIVRVS